MHVWKRCHMNRCRATIVLPTCVHAFMQLAQNRSLNMQRWAEPSADHRHCDRASRQKPETANQTFRRFWPCTAATLLLAEAAMIELSHAVPVCQLSLKDGGLFLDSSWKLNKLDCDEGASRSWGGLISVRPWLNARLPCKMKAMIVQCSLWVLHA